MLGVSARTGGSPTARFALAIGAVMAVALSAAMLERSPSLMVAASGVLLVGALLVWIAPSLDALSFWTFLAALVTAVPGPNLRPPGAPDAVFAYRVFLGGFAALLAVRLALRDMKIASLGRGPALLWLPIVGWAWLSLLWGEDTLAGFRYCAFLTIGVFLIFALQHYGQRPSRLRAMALACAITAVGVVAFGLVERKTGFHLPESAIHDLPSRYHWMLTSVFHNTNEFATYLALCLPALWVAALESWQLSRKLMLAGLCFAGIYCLLCTGSRANFIAVGLATATLVGLSGVRRPVRVVVLVVIACFVAYQVVSAVIAKATDVQLHALKISTVASEAAEPRGQMLKDGLAMLAATKGAGVGAGNVELHMARLGRQKQNVHNWWLEILVNLGVISFALYLAFYATTMLGLYRVYRVSREPYLQNLALGLLSGLVGFTIGCLSSSSLIAWAPMWIYFGLCVSTIESVKAQGKDLSDAHPCHFTPLS